jgi:hypothetical protein
VDGGGAGAVPAVLAYVDAVNSQDLDDLVQTFAPDAVITDVSRQIAGHDAIRDWADREVVGGSLRILDVVEDRPDGQKLLVHWAPAAAAAGARTTTSPSPTAGSRPPTFNTPDTLAPGSDRHDPRPRRQPDRR